MPGSYAAIRGMAMWTQFDDRVFPRSSPLGSRRGGAWSSAGQQALEQSRSWYFFLDSKRLGPQERLAHNVLCCFPLLMVMPRLRSAAQPMGPQYVWLGLHVRKCLLTFRPYQESALPRSSAQEESRRPRHSVGFGLPT